MPGDPTDVEFIFTGERADVVVSDAAVAAGALSPAGISAGRGAIEPGTIAELTGFLQAFSLPAHAPDGMCIDAFMSAMQGDKKVRAGKIRYVLLESLGKAYVTPDLDESEIALNL